MRSIYDCSPEARFSFAALAQHISTPLDRGTAAAVHQSFRLTTSVGSSMGRSVHQRSRKTMVRLFFLWESIGEAPTPIFIYINKRYVHITRPLDQNKRPKIIRDYSATNLFVHLNAALPSG
jgi:hypothetical protein